MEIEHAFFVEIHISKTLIVRAVNSPFPIELNGHQYQPFVFNLATKNDQLYMSVPIHSMLGSIINGSRNLPGVVIFGSAEGHEWKAEYAISFKRLNWLADRPGVAVLEECKHVKVGSLPLLEVRQ